MRRACFGASASRNAFAGKVPCGGRQSVSGSLMRLRPKRIHPCMHRPRLQKKHDGARASKGMEPLQVPGVLPSSLSPALPVAASAAPAATARSVWAGQHSDGAQQMQGEMPHPTQPVAPDPVPGPPIRAPSSSLPGRDVVTSPTVNGMARGALHRSQCRCPRPPARTAPAARPTDAWCWMEPLEGRNRGCGSTHPH